MESRQGLFGMLPVGLRQIVAMQHQSGCIADLPSYGILRQCLIGRARAGAIGSNRGIQTRDQIRIIIEQATVPVVVDAEGLAPVETDLGYRVRLREARMMVEDLSFTIAGEAHAAASGRFDLFAGWLVSRAYAHPGHYQEGDITGELPGRFMLVFSRERAWDAQVAQGGALYEGRCATCHGHELEGGVGPTLGGHPAIARAVMDGVGEMPAMDMPAAEVADIQALLGTHLGRATLLEGQYHSVNFRFGRAQDADGLPEGDPILGHTAYLFGVATRDDFEVEFEAFVDAPDDRELIGAPFDARIEPGRQGELRFLLDVADPLEGDTLFDGIDFERLPIGSDGVATLRNPSGDDPTGEDAQPANLLRRRLLTHDHYQVQAAPRSE